MHTIYLFLWNKQSKRQSSNWRSLGRVWKGSLGQNKVSAALFVFLSFFLESKCDTSLYSLLDLKLQTEYVFFLQSKLQNHREERMAAGALVYTTRNNFICRSWFLTISLICAVSVVTNLLGNSWFGSGQDVKFATTGSTVLYVFWLTDNFCAILHQFRIGCILHKTISLCTKLHISACAALKRLNSGYVWTVCTRWNKVQTGSQTLHLVTFVRATALVNYLLKALGA